MRISVWIGGMALAVVATIGLFSFQFAAPAEPAKADGKPIADDRDELANKLMERVTLKDPLDNVPLKEAVKTLSEGYGITLLVDANSFPNNLAAVAALDAADDSPVLNQKISVPAMKNVRLGTLIKEVADQVHGFYLIYPDQIRIVGLTKAYTLTKPLKADYSIERPINHQPGYAVDPEPDEGSLVPQDVLIMSAIDPLTAVSFNEKPLEDALKEISVRTNRTIVVANQAGESKKTPITARFTNVPVDRAVETIAEMAGLKMFRKGNVLLVTTPARAKELDPAPPPRPQIIGNGGLGGGIGPISGGVPTAQANEDLKKKIAELEKAIDELKQKN
jgi:hypothetical protein